MSDAPGLSAQAPQELIPTGRLRVAVAVGPAASALWATRDDETGAPRGVTVDLGTELAKRMGVPLELVVYSSSGAIIEAASRDEWDVAFTPVDAERKKAVDFGPDYFLGESTYLVPAGSQIRTIKEVNWPGVRVMGVENTATLRSARRTLTQTQAVGATSLDEAVAALRAGETDAIALGRESLASLLPGLPGARILPGHFHAAGTAVAVRKNRPAALAFVIAFIESAKADGTVRRAFDRHGMQDAEVAPVGSRS